MATGQAVAKVPEAVPLPIPTPFRRKLPVTRKAITHKFSVAGHEGYVTVGLYEDGSPGELFINMAKEGSTLSGMIDAFSITASMALQYGLPLKVLVEKFTSVRFEPSGYSGNPDIGYATSIMDYLFRWLSIKFLGADPKKVRMEGPMDEKSVTVAVSSDAPFCKDCGTIMQRAGSCYSCPECGGTSGCS